MTDRGLGWLLVSAQFALLGVLVLPPAGTAWSLPDAARTVGTVGRIAGAAGIVLGGLRLGLAASVYPAPTANAVLRTDGPYRYARHPSTPASSSSRRRWSSPEDPSSRRFKAYPRH